MFDRYGSTLELMQLMTRVNYHVAQFLSSSTVRGISNIKQIPDITTRLTKEVYFTQNQRVEHMDVGMDEIDPSQVLQDPILDQHWVVAWYVTSQYGKAFGITGPLWGVSAGCPGIPFTKGK